MKICKVLLALGGWSDIKTYEEFYFKNSNVNEERVCQVLNSLAGGVEKLCTNLDEAGGEGKWCF